MSESERWTRLYLARWPTGAVTLLAAESLEQVADLLDQVDDAAECEVVPYDGELWLTMQPASDPEAGPLALVHRPTLEVDSQEEIVEKAYPVLHRLIESARREMADGDVVDEPIAVDAWLDARRMEQDRILAPSPQWKAAVEQWWNAMGGVPPKDDGEV